MSPQGGGGGWVGLVTLRYEERGENGFGARNVGGRIGHVHVRSTLVMLSILGDWLRSETEKGLFIAN